MFSFGPSLRACNNNHNFYSAARFIVSPFSHSYLSQVSSVIFNNYLRFVTFCPYRRVPRDIETKRKRKKKKKKHRRKKYLIEYNRTKRNDNDPTTAAFFLSFLLIHNVQLKRVFSAEISNHHFFLSSFAPLRTTPPNGNDSTRKTRILVLLKPFNSLITFFSLFAHRTRKLHSTSTATIPIRCHVTMVTTNMAPDALAKWLPLHLMTFAAWASLTKRKLAA